MVKRLQRYIENEPWDRWLLDQEKKLNGIIRIFLLLAALFFAWPVMRVIWETVG